MVQIVLTQAGRQQAAHEGGLAAALRANQRRYTLIAVQHIHLHPVGNSRSQPDGQIVQLLRADARQTAEDTGHVVLSVPLRQTFQECLHGIVFRHLFRLHIVGYLRLWATLLQHVLALGSDHDALQGCLRQRAIVQFSFVEAVREAVGSISRLRQSCKLHLPVEHVTTETVVAHEELLNHKRSLL